MCKIKKRYDILTVYTDSKYSYHYKNRVGKHTMDIYEISFFSRFKCLEGSCPETCCRGWMIPLTNEDRDRYRREGGTLKVATALAVSRRDIVCFNSGSGECPFHNKAGLCRLQLRKGHDFIPEACRMYPRFYRNYREFEEHYVDLSCIGASRLFLENADRLDLIFSSGEPLSGACTTNDDLPFLDALRILRSVMLKRLADVDDFDCLIKALGDIVSYASKTQKAYLEGDTGFLTAYPFDSHRNTETPKDDIFPLSFKVIDAIMDTSFYNIRLKKTNPTLHHLCGLYFDTIASFKDAAAKWDDMAHDLMAEHKEAAKYLAAYYAYYLYLYYLKCYEDYSFTRNVRIGIIHTGMIFLLSALHKSEKSSLTADDLARIIAVYNRRAYFNDEILDEMYRCLDPL